MKRILFILIVLLFIVACYAVRVEKVQEDNVYYWGDARGTFKVTGGLDNDGYIDSVYVTVIGFDPNDIARQWSKNEIEDLIDIAIKKRGEK